MGSSKESKSVVKLGMYKDLGSDEGLRGYLLTKGYLYMAGEVYSGDSLTTVMALDVLGNMIEAKEVKIDKLIVKIVSSPGGDVGAALALYDALRRFGAKHGILIRTEASGDSMSAACMIVLQAGDWRVALPNTIFLLHEASMFTFSNSASGITDVQQLIVNTQGRIVEILSERCGRTKEEVTRLVERKTVTWTSENALEWGLIDEIFGAVKSVKKTKAKTKK